MKTAFSFLVLVFFFSCTPQKQFVYLQTADQGIVSKRTGINNQVEIKIQVDDILAIYITTIDGKAAAPYNLVRPDLVNAQLPITDFLVDELGDIQYPGLGTVKVAGLTVEELRQKLTEQLTPFLKDAVVNIRIKNFSFSVLGEVRNPGTYVTNGQVINLIQALGMAGDIADFGDREQVTLIREVDDQREVVVLNILESTILDSEYFYLMQNDVIYVPPTKGKSISARSEPLSRVILPILSVMTSLASLIIVATR